MIVQSKKWPHATDGDPLPVFICSIYPSKIAHMWLEIVQDKSSGHWTLYTSQTVGKFLVFFISVVSFLKKNLKPFESGGIYK